MQNQQPGQPAGPANAQPEPVTPSPEPVTPPSEPVTPPSEPVTPPSEPGTPPSEPGTQPSEPGMPPLHAEQFPVPVEDPFEQQLAIAKASLAEMQEATQLAEAELDNIRRRVLDDVERARKYAIESFAETVLPVKDSLETALQVETPSAESAKEGVELTLRQLASAFAKNQLQEIDPAPGERLDPARHKAISVVPGAPADANTVAGVLQKGYMIGDRLLRPALVTVGPERGGENADAAP
jgi:molecular chaperone GrpE